MSVRDRVVAYLGLDGDPQAGGRIPRWQGSPAGTAWRHVVLWAATAFLVYRLLDARMPEQDGLGGYAPGIIAVLVGVLGVHVTELARLRERRPDS